MNGLTVLYDEGGKCPERARKSFRTERTVEVVSC